MICGMTRGDAPEEAVCRSHLAEMEEMPKWKLDAWIRAGKIEAVEQDTVDRRDCDRRWRGAALVAMGEVLELETLLGTR
jgi:hypothetical protein